MTVSSAISRHDYVGNGTLDTYPFEFEIYVKTDLDVYVSGVLKTVDVHYTIPVGGINNPAGGNVIFTAGNIPALNAPIAIILDLPLTQLINYVEGDKFPAETHEKGLDRLVKIAQAGVEALSRTLQFSTSSLLKNIGFPIPGAGGYIRWNALGTGLEAVTSAGVILTESPDPPWANVRTFGAKGDGVTDDTAAIQAAIAAGLNVLFPDGTYKIIDEIILRSNQTITLSAGVTIRQYTADKNIFKATSKDNIWIHCNGAVLYGEGTWSAAWTGNSGHEDRGIQLINCTRSGITYPTMKNFSSAGIAVISGSRIRIVVPSIEGTNEYSTVVTAGGNFQNGIYLSDSVAYGALDDVVIVTPDVSGTAQGVLLEAQLGAADTDVGIQIVGPNIHDITGQHGLYIQRGKVVVTNPTLSDIASTGVKITSGDSNLDIKGFSITGAVASDLGSTFLELAVTGTGSISDVILSGTGDNIDGYGIAISGGVSNVKADLQLTDCANPVYIYGDIVRDIDITVSAKDSHDSGILVTATNATGIRIRPTLRESNIDAHGDCYGIHVMSASANVELYDPDVTDSNGRMVYGLFNATAGSIIKVRGSARFTGASSYAIRNEGTIDEWPDISTLSATTGIFWNGGGSVGLLPALADDATPSVAGGRYFLTGGTTTITNFDDGYLGQVITIISEHAITITDGTNIFLNGSANFVMGATDTLTLIMKADLKWYEIGRSDN